MTGSSSKAAVHRDIVATWPKSRPLSSYLDELLRAYRLGLQINYRVARLPHLPFAAWEERPGRCYMVHDGAVRGYNEIDRFTHRSDVRDPITNLFMPPGFYIVRDPRWHPIDPIPMAGFQGWRWFDEEEARHASDG
jgi:hypothetical protein